MKLPRAFCFNFVYFQPPSCFETRLFNMLCTYDFDIEYREVSGGKKTAKIARKILVGKMCDGEHDQERAEARGRYVAE